MPELLWEIGCEELPAGFIAGTLTQMAEKFTAKFGAVSLLGTEAVQTYGTPRRLTLYATGLAERQPDETVTLKGPAQGVAFDAEGKPTRAALGFAQKNGIDAAQLQVVDGYVQATVTRAGRSVLQLASELLPQITRELTFPKAMRWGASKMRFARPIRWIVALLDDQVIPFQIEHVPTGRTTKGHRFLAPSEIEIPVPAAYFPAMREASVLIEAKEREAQIVAQARQLEQEAGGVAIISDALLDENVYLTEYPTAVLGAFDPDFLQLPRPVLVTAMAKHQRYFPLVNADGNLLPSFIAIRNGGTEYLDTVRTGFETVLAARFNDARFFFDLDSQTPLVDKVVGTQTIVFQEKLGSVYEKSLRLGPILQDGGLLAGREATLAQQMMRAAELCKADLASEMVKELPSLQGIIGEEYARRDGEPEVVAKAISEHYQPKGAGDPLPETSGGRLLAIADRVDTLVGYLGLGIVPSGTSDPFALRRAASGLVALLLSSPTLPPLRKLFDAAWLAYAAQEIKLGETAETAYASFAALISQRLDTVLEEKGVRYDLREAVLMVPLTTLTEAESRALALNSLRETSDFTHAQAAATRLGNILRFAEKEGLLSETIGVDTALFADPSEGALWDAWQFAEPPYTAAIRARNWPAALSLLAALRAPVDAFFETVMVMDKDTALRDNRLALLTHLREAFRQIADFDKLVG